MRLRAIAVVLALGLSLSLAAAQPARDAERDAQADVRFVTGRLMLHYAMELATSRDLVVAPIRGFPDRHLIAVLEGRDELVAAKVAAYRDALAAETATTDAVIDAAMQLFREGREAEAYDVLDARADRKLAAWCAVGSLAAGTRTLDDVIARFEQLTSLEPSLAAAWIQLATLYSRADRRADAVRAATAAYKLLERKPASRARGYQLHELSDLMLRNDDLVGAQKAIERLVSELRPQSRVRSPSNDVLHDLSMALDQLAIVMMKRGNLAGARARLNEGLKLIRTMIARSPPPYIAHIDLARTLERLGDVAMEEHDPPEARKHYDEAVRLNRSLADGSWDAEAKQRLARSLGKAAAAAAPR